jgi:hypothetical protein
MAEMQKLFSISVRVALVVATHFSTITHLLILCSELLVVVPKLLVLSHILVPFLRIFPARILSCSDLQV